MTIENGVYPKEKQKRKKNMTGTIFIQYEKLFKFFFLNNIL